MKKEKYNLGPAWVLTADSIDEPVENWKNLGFTRGNIVAGIVPGRAVLNRTDQGGMTPIASHVYYHPDSFELTVPMLDKQIDALILVAPGSVKLTGDSKEAFAIGKGMHTQPAKAFCIVPVDQFEEGVPWWNAEDAIYISKGVANVSNRISVRKSPEEDDLGAHEVTVTQVKGADLPGGIGPIWIQHEGLNVVGLNEADSLEHAVPAASTRTALNGAGYTTVRGLVDETGALDISGSSLTDLRGVEYAFRASGIDVSDNDASEAEMSSLIERLWKVRGSLGLASCVIDISGNNGVTADATARINGTGAYAYEITALSQANRSFTVVGDRRDHFYKGRKLAVSGSTGNDGSYTVSSEARTIYNAADNLTTIFVIEAVDSDVEDGSINDGLIGAGCTVVTTA